MIRLDGIALDILASDPGTPEEGQIWYNTTDSKLKVYSGGTTKTFGTDDQLFHRDASSEIDALTEKASTAAADLLVVEDSEGSYVKKKVQVTNLNVGTAEDSDALVFFARKASVGTILKGKAVRVVSWNIAGYIEVEAADADAAATMPAAGIAAEDLTNSATGKVIETGTLSGFDTTGWSVGDELWVSDQTAGDLTSTKPDGTALIQKIAQVTRSNVANGSITIFGAGRSNDIPNIPQNSFWLGDANGVPQETNFDTEVSANADVSANTTDRHSHSNKAELDLVSDGNHDVRTDNPHTVTKAQISLSNVTDDAQLKRAANDISTFTEKGTPVSADLILIEDSADTGNKKKVQVGNLPGGSGTDDDAIHDNVSGEISAITEKTTPVSADLLLIEDSAASNAKKRVQVGNLPGGGGSHASTHLDGGADAIDADKLEISYVPNNYTRYTTPTEVDQLDQLTAHLYGIDAALLGEYDSDRKSKVLTSDIVVTSTSYVDIMGGELQNVEYTVGYIFQFNCDATLEEDVIVTLGLSRNGTVLTGSEMVITSTLRTDMRLPVHYTHPYNPASNDDFTIKAKVNTDQVTFHRRHFWLARYAT